MTALRRLERWVLNNRALSAAILAFVGTGATMLVFQRLLFATKRRARRADNNARTEVVVLAGSPTSSLTTSLALDLEPVSYTHLTLPTIYSV